MTGSQSAFILRGNEIHVGCDTATIQRGRSSVLRAAGSAYDLDLSAVTTSDALVDVFINEFAIPWPIAGVDAVISIGSELFWLPGTRTFWVTVRNIGDVPHDVLDDLVVALCNILDRMRTGGENYTVAFAASTRTEELLSLLAQHNEELAHLEHHPWVHDTHPVPVIDQSSGCPTPVGRSYYISSFPQLTNAIHLSSTVPLLDAARAGARETEAHLHRLDLEGVTTESVLLDRYKSAFGIRRPVHALTDLVPVEADRGFGGAGRVGFILIDGTDRAPTDALRTLCRLLVRSVDRRRRWGDRATVLFGPSHRTDELLSLLGAENRCLEDPTGESDTHPVAAIDHRSDPPG